MIRRLIILLVLFVIGCEENATEPIIEGCTTETACNYDSTAMKDDGSCTYAEENYDCNKNCIAELDCAGVCGGNAPLNECLLGIWVTDMNTILIDGESYMYQWIQALVSTFESDSVTFYNYTCSEEVPHCDNWWISGGQIQSDKYSWYILDNQLFIDLQTAYAVVESVTFNNPNEITINTIHTTPDGEALQSLTSHRCSEGIDCLGVCGGNYICLNP